ncbi:MAG: ABC transporter permease [Actinomycetota bacterium]|nr:ABC transporter permease [Actinomycetota bacterium]
MIAPAGLGLAGQPFIDWGWIGRNGDTIFRAFLQHLEYTVIAVGVGFLISFPLAVAAHRRRWLYPPLTWLTGFLYTIPSLALFVLLIPFTGLSAVTAEIGLVSYTLLILIRNIVTGLRGVPDDVKEAARGMGYTERQLLARVELPLALPAIAAGIRIATVTTIGLVTVTALIGKGGLGLLIYEGLRDSFATAALTGTVLCVALAIAADSLLLVGQRAITPWSPRRGRVPA